MDAVARTRAIYGRAGALLRDPLFWADRAMLVALFALVVVFGLLSPVFLTARNIESVLVAGSILVVLAVGQTFAIVTAGIDLSIGANVRLASIMMGFAVARGWSIWSAIVLAILAGTAAGLFNGLVIAKVRITDFIVTLGTLSLATGTALLISDARPVAISDPLLIKLATGSLGPIRYMVLVALIVAAVAHIIMFRTRLGIHLLAVGGNREAANSMGISVDRIKIVAYATSGMLAGIGGVMLTARVGAAEPAAGIDFLLNSIAAVVLGGVSLFGGQGSVVGPLTGALVLTGLLNGLTLVGVPVFYQPIAVGSVVIFSAGLTRFREV